MAVKLCKHAKREYDGKYGEISIYCNKLQKWCHSRYFCKVTNRFEHTDTVQNLGCKFYRAVSA